MNEPTGIEAQVCKDIADRQKLGISKYGTTVAHSSLSLIEWHRHQYEELLDAAVCARRIISDLETMQRYMESGHTYKSSLLSLWPNLGFKPPIDSGSNPS